MLEPLNGNNYYNWKFRVQLILGENKVFDITNKEVKVENFTRDEEINEFKRKDNKAKSLIVQFVADNELECLRDQNTAYKMWKTLETKYETKGLPSKMFLKKKLLDMKLQEGEPLNKYIHDFEEIVRQLKSSGTEMDEEDLTCNLLLGLPKSYQTVVTVIENLPKVTLEEVKVKLRGVYEKKKLSENRGTSDNQATF